MERLNEKEIAKAYKGKPFIATKLWKIAICSGNTRAVVSNIRLSKTQGDLIGITDEIYEQWWNDDIFFGVFIDIDEATDSIIESCCINKNKRIPHKEGEHPFIDLDPTQQDLEIFQNIMDFITNE